MENKIVDIILDDDRVISVELYPDKAPKTVENFLKLVEKNYYDGVVFHRIIDKFMIQTGGYKIVGNTLMEADDAEPIYGEFAANGFEQNDLKHKVGVISMARTSDPNSASGQFFLCAANCSHLNGQYAAFGMAIDETSIMNILDISHVDTCHIGGYFTDFPQTPISVKTIKVR